MNLKNNSPFLQKGQIHPTAPKIFKLLVEHSRGIIKNQRQAEMVIFGFIFLSIIFTFLTFFANRGSDTQPPPPGANVENAGLPEEIINP